MLVYQVGERETEDREQRHADAYDDHNEPHEAPCGEHHEKGSLTPTAGNDADRPGDVEGDDSGSDQQTDQRSGHHGRARAADEPAEPEPDQRSNRNRHGKDLGEGAPLLGIGHSRNPDP